MDGNVLYVEDGGVGIVTVNRPEVHNALNMETIQELRELCLQLEAEDRLRVMILTGAGDKTFLSGGDLKEFQHLKTLEEARHMVSTMKEVTDRLAGFPWPVIAAVNGLAVGGGCETAVACDFRIASESAKLGYRQVALGVISGWGGGPRLVHLLGKGRALRLMTTGDLLSANEALAIGLVDEVVSPDQVMPSALALARRIAENPPLAVRAFKRLVQMTVRVPLEAALEFETELFGPVWVSEDHDECVRAFFEKRKPNLLGR
ncbi:MAG TPA: enoyl-CoA hydratase-related protein [Candidatus Methylomirabilis sp.]|nr:enoyl-CoA hydratase-related protein [Candidatus Methylomirabilis sp.]